jgi:hypothetical protein
MLSLFRTKRTGRAADSPRRTARRPYLEALEDRAVPSVDVAALSASLQTPTAIRFEYRVTGQPGPFEVGVYRSADPVFDAGDLPVGTPRTLAPAGEGVRTATLPLGSELPLDPARKYVLVVADPGGAIPEQDESDNTASFRKLALGAVAHGYSLTGAAPAWVDQMADALQAKGYDAVIRFDWAPLSQLPVPGGAALAGRALAAEVRQAARDLAELPNDVVDVHFIGHSRGTAVVSQALLSLARSPGPRALRLGYFKETLLDPHVARNQGSLLAGLQELAAGTGVSLVGQFSYDPTRAASRLFAAGVLAFQALTHDPPPPSRPTWTRPRCFTRGSPGTRLPSAARSASWGSTSGGRPRTPSPTTPGSPSTSSTWASSGSATTRSRSGT